MQMPLSTSPTSSTLGMVGGANTPPENDVERVFIWDLDETIIIFHTLISGTYGKNFSKDYQLCYNIGYEMESIIYNLAEAHLFFAELMVHLMFLRFYLTLFNPRLFCN